MANFQGGPVYAQGLIKMAALGRDFHIGTLYNYRTDSIISKPGRSELQEKYQDDDHRLYLSSSFCNPTKKADPNSSIIKTPSGPDHSMRSEKDCLPWFTHPQSASKENFEDDECEVSISSFDSNENLAKANSTIMRPYVNPLVRLEMNCLPLNDMTDKWKHQRLSQHLQASVMSDLITKFQGSSKFCEDESDMSQAVRLLSMRFHVLNVSMENGNLPRPPAGSEQATHLVVKIRYGVQAFCVFTRYLKPGESKIDVEEEMDGQIQQFIHSVMEGQELKIVNNADLKARLYRDGPNSHPRDCSAAEACRLIDELKRTVEADPKKAVPMTVWLKPLDNSVVLHDLDEDALAGCLRISEGMNRVKSEASTFLRQDEQLKSFSYLRQSFRDLIQCLDRFGGLFRSELRRLLPDIRSGEKTHQSIVKLVNNVNEGLFHPEKLKRWMGDKRQEMRGLRIIAGLQGGQKHGVPLIQVQSMLDDAIFDVRHEWAVILVLPKLDGRQDAVLDSMRKYVGNNIRIVRVPNRQSSVSFQPEEEVIQPWYSRLEVCQELIQLARKMFQQLDINAEEAKSAPSVKFIMSTLVQLKKERNGCGTLEESSTPYHPTLALYRNGSLVDEDFQLPSPPSYVKIVQDQSFFLLEWECDFVKNVQYYLVQFQRMDEEESNKWLCRKTSSATNKKLDLSFLKDPSGYRFRVAAVTLAGRSPFSEVMEGVKEESESVGNEESLRAVAQQEFQRTNLSSGNLSRGSPIRPAMSIISSCRRIPSHPSGLEMYALPLLHSASSSDKIRRFDVGRSGSSRQGAAQSKTILVMGATGSGKSTLINAMVNYILGVEWEDPFRFELIVDEKPGTSQAKSQTSAITAYCLHHMDGFRIPYNLTVVDTPGYGDTEGLERDEAVTSNLSDFFKDVAGIQEVDAVGFVCPASLPRLTPTQIYIFDSVLSVFGNDIRDNVQFLLTFADGQTPPVLSAIEEANVPCPVDSEGHPEHHKFNICGFFASPLRNGTDGIDFNHLFWKMGVTNFSRFFARLSTMETKSLNLTRQVLEERKRLEVSLEGLQPMINEGLSKMEELDKLRNLIAANELQIDANVDVDFEVDVNVAKKVDISHTGFYLTNCQKCHVTCHYPCHVKNDSDKKRCSAMDGSEIGLCRICPNKCIWSVHLNQTYRWEYVLEKQTRSSEELRKKYEELVQRKLTAAELCTAIQRNLEEIRSEVVSLVELSGCCIKRLEEIALRPNPCSTPEYIDLMIKSEEQEKKNGFQQRIRSLFNIRQLAVLRQKIVNREPVLPPSALESSRPAPAEEFFNLFE